MIGFKTSYNCEKKKLKVQQLLLHKTYRLMWQWTRLVGFNHLIINKYLNCLFILSNTSVCKLDVVKIVVFIALFK